MNKPKVEILFPVTIDMPKELINPGCAIIFTHINKLEKDLMTFRTHVFIEFRYLFSETILTLRLEETPEKLQQFMHKSD